MIKGKFDYEKNEIKIQSFGPIDEAEIDLNQKFIWRSCRRFGKHCIAGEKEGSISGGDAGYAGSG